MAAAPSPVACDALVREWHRHRMYGTVILLSRDTSSRVDVDAWRAHGLLVHHYQDLEHALTESERIAPDVVVAMLSADDSASIVHQLRSLGDHATSVIVASVPEQRDGVHEAGADAFLLNSASTPDILYEIHRALILRRSGRRLPWNW